MHAARQTLTRFFYRVFQHDLYLLRLNTARSFIGALNTSANPVSDDSHEPIKLSAQVSSYVH